MSALDVTLLVLAAAFAIVNGANDGGSLVAVGLSVRMIPRALAVLGLAVSVVAVPLVLGTAVATTIAGRLVVAEGIQARLVLVAAAVAAILVTGVLAFRGLPTSMTLALIGGLSGAGLGAGLSVSWSMLGVVLGVAALAPVLGALCAVALTKLALWVPMPEGAPRRVRWLHVLGYTGVCIAYGANDGQKMLAVFALATGTVAGASATVAPQPWLLAAVGGCFLLGTFVGMRSFAGTIVGGVVPPRPDMAVTTELSAAAVVAGSATLGMPVSMTQAVSGALVGTGSSGGRRSVRWRLALRLVWAWLITLPVSFGVAAAVGLGVVAVWR